MDKRDLLFAVTSISLDFLDSEQLSECLAGSLASPAGSLSDILVERGHLDRSDVEEILQIGRYSEETDDIGVLVLLEGLVSDDALREVLSLARLVLQRHYLRPEKVFDLVSSHYQSGSGSFLETLAARGGLLPQEIEDLRQLLEGSAAPFAPSVDPQSLVGREFDGLRIEEEIAEGGMGRIYRAVHLETGRTLAVKTISDLGDAGKARERFRQEIRKVNTLDHPNVVRIHGHGVVAASRPDQVPLLYYAMDYFAGPTFEVMIEDPLVPRDELVTLLVKTADGLGAAHEQGLIHRDVKPANIVVEGGNQPRLIDFGLVKQEEEFQTSKGRFMLTREGELLGSPAYMAPEQIRGERDRIGPTADVYSMGVILYRILYAQMPFLGRNLVELSSAICDDYPPFGLGASPRLVEICRRCLDKEPRRRYASGKELAAALRAWQSERDSSSSLRRASAFLRVRVKSSRRIRRGILIGVAGALAIAVPVVLWSYFDRRGEQQRHLQLLEQALLRDRVEMARIWAGKLKGAALAPQVETLIAAWVERQNRLLDGVLEARKPDYRRGLRIAAGVASLDEVRGGALLRRFSIAFRRRPPPNIARSRAAAIRWKRALRAAGLAELARMVQARAGKAYDEGRLVELLSVARRRIGGRDLAGALGLVREAQRIAPGDRRAVRLLWITLVRLERWQEFEQELPDVGSRIAALEGLAARGPLDGAPRYALYRIHERAGRVDQARKILDEAAGRHFPYGIRHGLERIRWAADGSEMVLVRSGWCTVGADRSALERFEKEYAPHGVRGRILFSDEAPRHRVRIDSYYIDRHPVTWRQYRRFRLALRKHGTHPAPWCHPDEPPGWRHDPFERLARFTGDLRRWTRPDLPVVFVGWWDAHAYAAWAGKALPSESMWEKAASWDPVASRATIYPWGDRWDPTRCNSIETWASGAIRTGVAGSRFWRTHFQTRRGCFLKPVGSHSAGRSHLGVEEMAGTVHQWIAGAYTLAHPDVSVENPRPRLRGGPRLRRVRKGGCFAYVRTRCRASFREATPPNYTGPGTGFRCSSPPP